MGNEVSTKGARGDSDREKKTKALSSKPNKDCDLRLEEDHLSEKSIESKPLPNINLERESGSNKRGVKTVPIQLSETDIERAKVVAKESEHISNIPSAKTASPRRNSDMVEHKNGSEDDDGDDFDHLEPKDILFQFIPFYGQGDTSTDSIVRATLSSLSVEEIDSRDAETGNTLLLLACQYRCEDLARIMVNKGADCNAVNNSGACCLHFACYRDSSSKLIAKLLLKNGAHPDVQERSYGCAPIHYCAGLGDIDFIKIMLQHGATIDLRDSYNYTCADYAREAGLTEVAAFLDDKIKKTQTAAHLRGANATGARGAVNLGPPGAVKNVYGAEWQGYLDPVSGASYFVNSRTAECLWELDLKSRIEQEGLKRAPSKAGDEEVIPILSLASLDLQSTDDFLKKKISFVLSPNASLPRKPTMGQLFEEGQQGGAPPIGMDSFAVQTLINEAKGKLEEQFEEEKAKFRSNLSEKDGLVSKLESEIEILRKDKLALEVLYTKGN